MEAAEAGKRKREFGGKEWILRVAVSSSSVLSVLSHWRWGSMQCCGQGQNGCSISLNFFFGVAIQQLRITPRLGDFYFLSTGIQYSSLTYTLFQLGLSLSASQNAPSLLSFCALAFSRRACSVVKSLASKKPPPMYLSSLLTTVLPSSSFVAPASLATRDSHPPRCKSAIENWSPVCQNHGSQSTNSSH